MDPHTVQFHLCKCWNHQLGLVDCCRLKETELRNTWFCKTRSCQLRTVYLFSVLVWRHPLNQKLHFSRTSQRHLPIILAVFACYWQNPTIAAAAAAAAPTANSKQRTANNKQEARSKKQKARSKKARSKKQEARSKKQEARSKKKEARSKKEEARSKKQEARSKKQEAKSKKEEARSKKQEARSKKQEARSKKQEARSKKQEARSKKQEARSKKQEARSKKQEARSKKQEARSKKQEARSKKQEARSKKQEARSKKQEAGSKKQEARSKKQEARSKKQEEEEEEEEEERRRRRRRRRRRTTTTTKNTPIKNQKRFRMSECILWSSVCVLNLHFLLYIQIESLFPVLQFYIQVDQRIWYFATHLAWPGFSSLFARGESAGCYGALFRGCKRFLWSFSLLAARLECGWIIWGQTMFKHLSGIHWFLLNHIYIFTHTFCLVV